jgi:uncharacterized protein (DUF1330 family)
MPAYMIATRIGPVRDAAALAEYSRLNRENAANFQAQYNVKPLVVYGTLEVAEGPAPDGIIILQFPSMADAKAWYNSPGYTKARAHRHASAKHREIFVEGFTMPPA